MSASVDDGARFVRQRLLTEVGDAGQEHLRATPVQLLGGSHAARMHARDYLARAGVRVVRDDEPRDAGRDAPAVGRDAPGRDESAGARDACATVAAVTQRVVDPPDHPRSLQPAADLLMGALAAVEAVKGVLALGQPAALPPDLLLLGED